MPNTKSAKKALRSSLRKQIHNKKIKRKVKDLIKKTRQAVQIQDKTSALTSFQEATKALDKAAKKNVIHQNKAARVKSRLAKKINVIIAP